MHMKHLLALCLLLVCACAAAQTPKPKPAPPAQEIKVEVLWYGVVGGDQGQRQAPEQTDRVPARQGAEFGVIFAVTGAPPGSKLTLRQIARYPAPGRRLPESGKLQKTDEADTECDVSEPCTTSYLIEARDEIIPGEWTLELHYRGRKVMEQKFYMRYEGV